MHLATRFLSTLIAFALVSGGFTAVPSVPLTPWQSKVDPWVLQTAAKGETEFLVFLTEQADLSQASALKTKLEKGTFVFEKLIETAARTQSAIITDLKNRGAEYHPYWVANIIWVRGSTDLVQAMAKRSDITHVYANPKVKLDQPDVAPGGNLPASPDAVEWNINRVKAPHVWAAGFTGQGAVVAGQDTGYQWNHPALINQYRGWNGASVDHNYSWHDAIHSGGGICGPNSPEPCDDQGHGTHTMGTIVGNDGGANQIGMAPGARWIGCRNMDEGVGTPATYAECYQWFIAPTRLDGTGADPSKAPDVINNSWGCPDYEGCTDPNVLLTVVENVVAAGILTNHSAGNEGSGCSTVSTPAAIYDASFTVGATDSSDNIAGFSSRGPVLVDGSGRMKPDISAPGVGIRSSTPGNGYSLMSGTSMAGPHITGLVALLISANPGLAGKVNDLESIIEQSAVPLSTGQGCGGDSTMDVPNNVYGWGRIDASAAYQSLSQELELIKTASAEIIHPGEILTYTLSITNPHASMSISNVIITDTIPTGTTFITATLPYSMSGDVISWSASELSPLESWSVELVVRAPITFTGNIVNENYAVQSDEVETFIGAPITTTLQAIDLNKTTSRQLISFGDLITYTLQVTNLHPVSVTHELVLTDTIPVGTSFISATLPYTITGDDIAWRAGNLDPGEAFSVTLSVEVSPEAWKAVSNDNYFITSKEVIEPIYGDPVVIPFKPSVYFPRVFKNANPDLARSN